MGIQQFASHLQDQVPHIVVKYRRAIWITLLVMVLPACLLIPRLQFDGSLEIWFLENDPNIVKYQQFRDQFGRDEMIFVGFESEELFSPAALDLIARITEQFEQLPLVGQVLSLTNVQVLANEDSGLKLKPLITSDERTGLSPIAIRQRVASQPLVARYLLSENGLATAIVLVMAPHCATAEQHIELTKQVREISQPLQDQGSVYITGIPVVNDAMFRYARKDLVLLSPLVFLIVWGTTWILYRDLRVALLPLTVVGLSLLSVFAVMAILGWRVNFLISALTLAIMVIGVANSVHIISAWYEQQAKGLASADAVRQAIRWMLPPCFMTSISTCVGFLSLTVTNVRPIRQFGVMAALGTMFAFVLCIMLLPGLLCQFRSLDAQSFERRQSNHISRLLRWLGRPTRRTSQWIVAVSVLLMVPVVWGIRQVETTANPLNYFRQGEPIRVETEAIDELFRGSSSVEFRVEAAKAGLSRRAVLRSVEDFQRWLQQNLAVSSSLSIVDYLKEADRTREGRTSGRVPSRNLYTILTRLKRNAPVISSAWLNDDFSVGRISARLPLSRADELAVQIPMLEKLLADKFSTDELRIETTGYVKLINNMRIYLLTSQVKSLILAAVGVTLMLCWMLRSVALGLLSMVPNLIPVAMGIAVMGIAGIRLDPGTVMIGSIALGLVVDDSCHFLSYFRRERQQGADTAEAICTTMQHTGRPIILTTVILCVGFLGLAAGSFAPSIYFGVIMSVIVAVALVADLVLTPAILCLASRVSKVDAAILGR